MLHEDCGLQNAAQMKAGIDVSAMPTITLAPTWPAR
jgi:hypothetical protein